MTASASSTQHLAALAMSASARPVSVTHGFLVVSFSSVPVLPSCSQGKHFHADVNKVMPREKETETILTQL